MQVKLFTDELSDAPAELVAVGTFSDEPDRGLTFSSLNRMLDGGLERACRDEEFKGNRGQSLVYNVRSEMNARRVFVFGFGEREKYSPPVARDFAIAAARCANKVNAKSIVLQLSIPEVPASAELILGLVQALSEGVVTGSYAYLEHRTKEAKTPTLDEVRIAFVAEDVQGMKGADLRGAVVRGEKIAAAVNLARDLVNAPPNLLTPVEMAERARKMAKTYELDYKILGVRDLERQGMQLHLGVGKGSRNEPRLIHLTYTPELQPEGTPTIALVGKGITFDAGGLSLKTSEGMMEMKIDMGGAAAVIGTMRAIAELQPPVVVHGIVGAAENMPGGEATRPGDVLKSKKGITVEVLNTDAEGRLVLADALAYAQELSPHEIIDLATLTGACMVALGKVVAGAFVNDEVMAARLQKAWQRSGELFWPMPLQPELREQLNSEVADIKNIGERFGGAITAALFLKEFIDEGMRWAHLDIAGPVYNKGGTGFGVTTLVEYISAMEPLAGELSEVAED